MTLHGMNWEEWGFIGVLILLACLGTTCLISPAVIVRFLQRQYRDGSFFRMTLFSEAVFKPWYAVLVRYWGLVLWSFVILALIGLVSSSR